MSEYVYDDALFSDKYEKYSLLIYRTAYHYMLNTEAAEDITQDVFVKLLTKLKKFRDDEHEKAWLLRVTINLCKNALSLKKNNDIELNDDIGSVDEGFEQSTIERLDMNSFMLSLSAQQRTIIFLYYYEKFTIGEISKITNIKENTVKSHLRRGKESLRKIIEGE